MSYCWLIFKDQGNEIDTTGGLPVYSPHPELVRVHTQHQGRFRQWFFAIV